MHKFKKERQIYFRARNPNPLFEGWLEQWISEAERKDSRKKFALAKALESLKKYPLVLYSGRDCSILEGFGTGICTMLDEQLEVYQKTNPGSALLNEAELELMEQTIICDVSRKIEEKVNEKVEANGQKVGSLLNDTMEALFQKYGDLDDVEKFDRRDSLKDKEENDAELLFELTPPEPVRTKFVYECPKMVVKKNSYKIILLVDTQETAGLVNQQYCWAKLLFTGNISKIKLLMAHFFFLIVNRNVPWMQPFKPSMRKKLNTRSVD